MDAHFRSKADFFGALESPRAPRLGRNNILLLLEASRDLQLSFKSVSLSCLYSPTLSELTPVTNKARAPKHKWEVAKVDLNRISCCQYSRRDDRWLSWRENPQPPGMWLLNDNKKYARCVPSYVGFQVTCILGPGSGFPAD